MLDELTELVKNLQDAIKKLDKAINSHVEGSTMDHATHARDKVVPAMVGCPGNSGQAGRHGIG